MKLPSPRRAPMWVVPLLTGVACATASVAPPPSLDEARIAEVRSVDPAIAEELELLEWEARERARQGDGVGAERRARLARRLLEVSLSRRTCPEPLASAVPEPPAAETPAPRPRKRKRRRPEPAVALPPASPAPDAPASLENELQSLAEGLRAFSPEQLSPTDRVRLGTARQALVEAQEALTAEAPERARLYLDRARDSMHSISGEGDAPSPPRPAREAFAADVTRSLPDAKPDGPSFIVLLETSRVEELTRGERARLEAIGRLFRVYERARLCVGGRPSHAVHVAAAARFLERHERLGARVELCSEETREPAYVRLRPGRGERG